MDVKLPKLGEGADSGTVVSILVREGDPVAQGQTILELENEKAVAPIPSPAAGKVGKIRVKEGDKVSAGQVILVLVEAGEAVAPATPAPARAAKAAPRAVQPAATPQPVAAAEAPEVVVPAGDLSEPTGPEPPASPGVRKIAKDLGIDLRRVKGSQRGGRVILGDLRSYVEHLQKLAFAPRPAAATAVAPTAAAAPVSIDFSQWGPVTRKPLSQLRQVIARRLSESWRAVPRVTQFDDADITGLNDLRKKHAPAFEKKGTRLTLTVFALKAVVTVLKQFPAFNSSLDEATGDVVIKDYFHLGLAVDTEAGLVVPVIRNVDQKGMLDLAREVEGLAAKARDRKLSLEEMKGGTFTISNQGGIGGAHFTPVVNLPEAAILGLGRGALKPVVRDGKIEPRLMLPMGLSYDHRIIDGGTAARFMVELVKAFENFPAGELKG